MQRMQRSLQWLCSICSARSHWRAICASVRLLAQEASRLSVEEVVEKTEPQLRIAIDEPTPEPTPPTEG